MRNRIFTIFLVVIAAIFFVGCGEKIGPNNNNGGGSGVGKNGLFANGSPIGCNLTINGVKVGIDETGRVGQDFLKKIKDNNITDFKGKQMAWNALGFGPERIVLDVWENGVHDSDSGYTIYFNNDFKLSEVKSGLKIEQKDVKKMQWKDSEILTDEDYVKWSENYDYKVDYSNSGLLKWWKKLSRWKITNYNIGGNITVVSINQDYATITIKFNNFVMGTYHDDKPYPINPYPLFTINGTATIPFRVYD